MLSAERFEVSAATGENERRAVVGVCYSAPPVLVGMWDELPRDCGHRLGLREDTGVGSSGRHCALSAP